MDLRTDPWLDVSRIFDEGPTAYLELLEEQNMGGYGLYQAKHQGAAFDPRQEELYQTLFCLEHYGDIVPYQNRSAVVHSQHTSPWARVGRPSKAELLMIILLKLARASDRPDSAVLLSGGPQETILGFDYGHFEKDIDYIAGSSLLLSSPSTMTKGGTLISVQAPHRFNILQAENKGISKLIYYDGILGKIERSILSALSDKVHVIKLRKGFWNYQSPLDPDYEAPLPFQSPSFSALSPIALAATIALISSTRANCLRRKVGAVFVDLYETEAAGRIRSIGYNGFKSHFGATDSCDRYFCNKRRHGAKDDLLCFSPCAEIDAFRGYYHDESFKHTQYRATLNKRNPESVWTASITTIEPCDRCVAILFQNGVFDFYPLNTYDLDRTAALRSLRDSGKINVKYLRPVFGEEPPL